MHMADALISPAVGGAVWAATAGLTVYSARKLKQEMDDRKLPLMGVLGAFVFAAQMINFTIPATGSSGHLGGGMILAILLGPYAAFLTMASVLTVQALFFADGGLLALGCNIFNLGFFPCFIAYPFIYKKTGGRAADPGPHSAGGHGRRHPEPANGGVWGGAGNVVLGYFGVALLNLRADDAADPPGHRHCGRPRHRHGGSLCLEGPAGNPGDGATDWRRPRPAPSSRSILSLVALVVFTGGFLSWFASTHPDGLEWAIKGVTGKEEVEAPKAGAHGVLAALQEKLAFLPDYDFKKPEGEAEAKKEESWPDVNPGRSLAGVLGAAITLLLVGAIGFGLKKYASHHG